MRPSSAALLSTERIILETLFCEIMISLLICAKLGEALSFTSPNRFIIESILFSILAKVKVSFTKFISEGNLFGSASEINCTNSRSVEIFFFNAIKSLVSKKVPSAFVSANWWRKSITTGTGKAFESVMSDIISFIRVSDATIVSKSLEKEIFSASSTPQEPAHFSSISERTESKPILCSKLSGYSIR